MNEKTFQGQVIELAKLYGWKAHHAWLSVRSEPGVPDLLLVRPPRVVFIELKSANGRVSPAQHEWLEALQACPGVETYLYRPSDMQDIARLLARELHAA